jgi:putative ABC transport system permease protein
MPEWKTIVRRQHAASIDDDVLDEVVQHAEELYTACLAAGQSPAEAQARVEAQLARLPATLKSAQRPRPLVAHHPLPEPSAGLGLASFGKDLFYGLRLLTARPGFTVVALLTLALGIGANTAVFSVVNTLLIQPLPFPDPDRLVMVWEQDAETPDNLFIVSKPNYEDFATMTTSFERTAIWEYQSYNLAGDGDPEQVPGMRVSSSLFQMLGVSPHLGRTFTAVEDQPGHDVAVISHRLWVARYGSRPDIVGHRVRLNGRPFEVIGVMPAGFYFTNHAHGIWVPIQFRDADNARGSHSFFAAARLKPGVSFETAKAELEALGRRLAKEYEENEDESASITRMDQLGINQGLRSTLLTLLGSVGLVLLIACANVANLLLAQASAREREFAIRAALGAGRVRICTQLLAEGLVLSIVGAAAGIGVALATTSALASSLPPAIRNAPFRGPAAVPLDVTVLAFTLGVALLTAIVFSLFPAIAAIRSTAGTLKITDTRSGSAGSAWVRNALITVELALAIVVLAGAGLTIKSMARLMGIDPGLDPSNVLTQQIALPQRDFYGPPERESFCADVARELSAIPGVVASGAISHLPLSGANAGRGLQIDGSQDAPGETPGSSYRLTCPGYFGTMGIQIVQGRDFAATDRRAAEGVVIVNEAAAERYWPGQDPLGKRLRLTATDQEPWLTVIGVVRNVRHFGLDSDIRREIFRPYSQAAWPVMTVIVKTSMGPAVQASAIRTALRRADPEWPVSNVRTMEEVMQASVGSRRFPMLLLGVFASVALALAVVGVYGVVSYVVSQRRKEIGIRVALGAGRSAVTRHVMRGSVIPVAVGITVGIGGAVAASRLLESVLYEVRPSDPIVLGSIALLLATAALAASWFPARRAARLDPLVVLRE